MRNVKTWGILFLASTLLPGAAYAKDRSEGTVISQEDKEPDRSDCYRKREPVGAEHRS